MLQSLSYVYHTLVFLRSYVFVKFYQRKRPLNWLKLKLVDHKRKYQSTSRSRSDEVTEPEESLPDRIIHPERYQAGNAC